MFLLTITGTAGVFFLPDSSGLGGAGGFYRHYPPNLLSESWYLNLTDPTQYIAGYSPSSVFLAGRQKADSITRIELRSAASAGYVIPVPTDRKLVWSAARIRIDSPYIYLTEHISRYYSARRWGAAMPIQSDQGGLQGIQQLLSLSPYRIAVRTYDTTRLQNVLQVLNTDHRPVSPDGVYVPDKQRDGVFCTDGILKYDSESALVLYVYNYRNRFVLLDTTLKVRLTATTIDTTDQVNFTVGSFTDKNTVTSSFSSPPRMVNKNAFFNNSFIFIHSALMSDNEKPSDFRRTSVLDIYRVADGKYVYSVKVPDDKGEKVRDFIVSGDRLLLLYGSGMICYRIALPG